MATTAPTRASTEQPPLPRDGAVTPSDRTRRTRWAAIGAAVAVSLGAGTGLQLVGASEQASAFVPVEPARILDTRTGVGLAGPFPSTQPRDLRVTGSVPVATPTGSANATVVPAGATAVVLNVTVVNPTADGFVSVRPSGLAGPPTTSNLNFTAGTIIPNAVTVALPSDGRIEITYSAFGVFGPTTDILVDVTGYYAAGGTGATGPRGPAGPTGPTGPAGASASPDIPLFLPVAMGRVSANSNIVSSYGLQSVANLAGQYELTLDFAMTPDDHVATVTVVSGTACDDNTTTSVGEVSGRLAVRFRHTNTNSRECPFTFVVHRVVPGGTSQP